MEGKKRGTGTVLVTGAAVRIGGAIAIRLAELGFQVALHYHQSKKEAEAVCRKIRLLGRRCELFRADLTKPEELSVLIPKVRRVFPNLNLLVNNASVFLQGKLIETDENLFNRNFDVNVKAPFFLSRDFARVCQNGQIVNLLDTRIACSGSNDAAYTLSKKNLAAFTEMAARELSPAVRVNGIAPGLILQARGRRGPSLDRLAKKIPLRRKGNVSDILQALEFLICSEYVTGQIIYVDGGQHLL